MFSKGEQSKNVEAGQKPDAVVVTCSDSRVPSEHIFRLESVSCLWSERLAMIGDFELGSIEYAVII